MPTVPLFGPGGRFGPGDEPRRLPKGKSFKEILEKRKREREQGKRDSLPKERPTTTAERKAKKERKTALEVLKERKTKKRSK